MTTDCPALRLTWVTWRWNRAIINCGDGYYDIMSAIKMACSKKFRLIVKEAKNPYESNFTASKIYDIVIKYLYENKMSIVKKFFDYPIK